jgi:hypothetical protein
MSLTMTGLPDLFCRIATQWTSNHDLRLPTTRPQSPQPVGVNPDKRTIPLEEEEESSLSV